MATDYNRIIGFFHGTDEYQELLDTTLCPVDKYAYISIQWYVAGIERTPGETWLEAIKAQHPSAKILAYMNFGSMIGSPHEVGVDSITRPTSLVTQEEAAAHGIGADSWFLHPAGVTAKTITTSSTATPPLFTTSTTHSFSVGQYVVITGHSISARNDVWKVASVPTSTTFTVENMTGGSSGTGGSVERIEVYCDYEYLAWAHIGRSSWRTQASSKLTQIATDGFDGVFLDDVNTQHDQHCWSDGFVQDITTAAAYRTAMLGAMAVITPAARTQGLLSIPNVGVNAWDTSGSMAAYRSLLTNNDLDAVVNEFFTNWGGILNDPPFTGTAWSDRMNTMIDAEGTTYGNSIPFLANTYQLNPVDHFRALDYGLASFWANWNGTAASVFGYNSGQFVSFYYRYRKLLGNPLEAKQLVSGTSTDGAWIRHYSGGVVIINARSGSTEVTFPLGATYLDYDDDPITSMNLFPGYGQVLLLPEVVVGEGEIAGAGSRLTNIIEVAFASQPMSTTPIFTDITPYVLLDNDVVITHGRTDEFGKVQPGTATYTLDNSEGRFTRNNTSSPYYPGVRNERRIRHRYAFGSIINWLPKSESNFEISSGNWTVGGGGSGTRAAEQPDEGTYSFKMTGDGTGGLWFTNGANNYNSAVYGTTGQAFTHGIRLKSASATRSWRAVLRWLAADNTYHSQTNGTATSCGSGGYTQISVSGTMPSGATKVLAQFETTTTASNGEIWYADKAQLTKTATLQTWEAGPIYYQRFDGHVNNWPAAWQTSTYAPVVINATDRFKRFGEVGELRSIIEEEYLRDVTTQGSRGAAYYPLSEAQETGTVGNITQHSQGFGTVAEFQAGGELTFGGGIGPGTDELSAPLFEPGSSSAGKYLDAQLFTPVGGNSGATLECFIRAVSGLTNRDIVSLETTHGRRMELFINGTGGLLGYTTKNNDVANYTLNSPNVIAGTGTRHVALTESISGTTITARLYVDGIQVASTTYSDTAIESYQRLYIGGEPRIGQLFSGTISHVAAYSTALSSARLQEHAKAGRTGLAGERTDSRIYRISDWVNIPTADRNFDIGDSTVGWQSTSGDQPIEAMQEVEETENGVLFIAYSDGKLTFHKRSRRFNVSTFITLDAAQADQIGINTEFPGDDFGLINDASADRPRNSSVRAINTASRDEYGLHRYSTTILDDSDTRAQAVVDWYVNNYGQPLDRVPNVTVNLWTLNERNPALTSMLLGAEISTALRLSNLPAQAPTSTVDIFIEGWTETIGVASWSIVFNCSPATSYSAWQLGIVGYSELGITTKLAL